jgi:hypothetical protein
MVTAALHEVRDEMRATATAAAAAAATEGQQANDDDEEDEAECPICLGELPPSGQEGGVLLTCSHVFHDSCLERWKDKCLAYTCAMCRRPVVVAESKG